MSHCVRLGGGVNVRTYCTYIECLCRERNCMIFKNRCAACTVSCISPLQLNYYSMESEFTTETLVFTKSYFSASNVVSGN